MFHFRSVSRILSKTRSQPLKIDLQPLLTNHLFLLFRKFKVSSSFEKGASISVEGKNFITFLDNSFICGFYGMGSKAYWFAIWFINSKEKTAVWTANWDRLVNSQGSRLSIRRDGTMVLTDIDGSIKWQTNTTSADVAAELLNTGNLVFDESTRQIFSGKVLMFLRILFHLLKYSPRTKN
ncbi:unnamed protein product [Fraxinus pennsylvanica]|uniref:Bulb-type lectin domain-containing protein n=1 Tax=Fraxinus pennsylvanica TaxID=56036 RepID=A0AAD2A4Z6_9LAMI|nr:unnamed protein product [Fraxinus pennsylvanica]